MNDGPGIKPWTSPIIPHSKKPKPIAFFWEFWGDELCSNHEWRIRTYNEGTPICPALPFASSYLDVNIVDGALEYRAHTAGGTQQVQWYESLSGETGPDVGNCLLKIAASMVSDNVNNYAALILGDSTGRSIAFYILAGSGISFSEYKVWIGDNAGEPQTIVLADHGLSGRITSVRLFSKSYLATINIDLDYLTFPAV